MAEDHSTSSELEQFLVPERAERLRRVAQMRTRTLTLVLDRVANPHNISAVMRTADAFGIQELHLIGDEFAFSGAISLGAEQWLDIRRYTSAPEAIAELRGRGFRFVTLEAPALDGSAKQSSVPVYRLPFQERLALVFGNEHKGISDDLRTAADLHAYIPMFGFVESFNISVAAAITMFCSLLGDVSGERAVEAISAPEQTELFDRWAEISLRGGDKVRAELARRRVSESEQS